jgi:hypothetical protein
MNTRSVSPQYDGEKQRPSGTLWFKFPVAGTMPEKMKEPVTYYLKKKKPLLFIIQRSAFGYCPKDIKRGNAPRTCINDGLICPQVLS